MLAFFFPVGSCLAPAELTSPVIRSCRCRYLHVQCLIDYLPYPPTYLKYCTYVATTVHYLRRYLRYLSHLQSPGVSLINL